MELQFPSSLPKLEYLYLQKGNKIQDISFLQNSLSIQTVNLSGNAIEDLSPLRHAIAKGVQAKWKKSGTGILVEDCPLVIPSPEIIEQGNEAILNFFEAQDQQGTDTIYEAKLLIVGEGEAGKTTLCRRLLDPNLPMPEKNESTKGIDIHRFEFPINNGKQFRINVWDFGGQEIYHATHQFFLTKRSLYILLDNTRKNYKTVHDEGFKYWLEVIDLLGEDSPILIFQNEKDGRSKQIDLDGIRGRFGQVKELYAGDLIQPESIGTIKEAIKYFVQQLPHIGERLPKKWINIRQEVEEIASKKPFISQTDYFNIYRQHLEFDRKQALYLSQYLHDLGVFLHFQDDDLLARTVILENTWATEAVFKILDNEIVKEKLGRFTEEDCDRIWAESTYSDKHPELRALMMKFELCYLLRDIQPRTWLAPQLLAPSKPGTLKKWELPTDLVIRYRYEFMPKGIINRLMVRQHRVVPKPELGWKNGVLFERRNTQLLAQLSEKGDEIILNARGPEHKELLSVISADLETLNETFANLSQKVTKRIPCICNSCAAQNEPRFYDYDELIRRKSLGKQTIECRKSFEDISVGSLLNGILADQTKKKDLLEEEDERQKPKKVFFSYSKHDRDYLVEFQKHLSVLHRNGLVEPWDDHHILPGEEWDERVKQKLAHADLILLLVSADFLATNYIWEVEIEGAMQRHEQGDAKVIPVILRHCDWEDTPFDKLNGLPSKAKPISSYSDQDQGWLDVVKGIKRLLNREGISKN